MSRSVIDLLFLRGNPLLKCNRRTLSSPCFDVLNAWLSGESVECCSCFFRPDFETTLPIFKRNNFLLCSLAGDVALRCRLEPGVWEPIGTSRKLVSSWLLCDLKDLLRSSTRPPELAKFCRSDDILSFINGPPRLSCSWEGCWQERFNSITTTIWSAPTCASRVHHQTFYS